MQLKDRIAIVTGAAHGIGFAIAREFVREGASVCFTDIDTDLMQSSMNASDLDADRSHMIALDVTDERSVADAVAQCEHHFGQPDILVNGAATLTPVTTIETLSLEHWQQAFDVNVTGAFLMSKAVLPHLKKRNGVIINVASQLATVAAPERAAYCSTKGALLQLTKATALDHAQDGVRVNSLSPGATLTNRLRHVFKTDEAATAAFGPKHPIGRLGTAEEIGRAAVFLASGDSSFMTGADLVIDGGYTSQ